MKCAQSTMRSKQVLDIYFLENRARLLEVAAFLDRLDRTDDPELARQDPRYRAFFAALRLLQGPSPHRTGDIQLLFSDPTDDPIQTAEGRSTIGVWEGFA